MDNLAIISGEGRLPDLIYKEMIRQGVKTWTFCPQNISVETSDNVNKVIFDLFDLENLFLQLQERKINNVVFAGKITRLNSEHPRPKDLNNIFYKEIYPALQSSDDIVLRKIGNIFEAHGFTIKGVIKLLPSSLASGGVLTREKPSLMEGKDVKKAEFYHNILSKADIGQSLVVSNGLCLAIETLPGTDAMLDFVRTVKSKASLDYSANTGLLYKAPKPNQDMRFDVPVVGETTLRKVKEANLRGIALRKNCVILLEKEKIIQLADELSLFIVNI